ncbi:hypothetical protein D3C78_1596140 [compost metagenome]
MVKIDARRIVRARTAGDDDMVGADSVLSAIHIADADGVGVDKACVAGKQLALVALIESLTHPGLLIYDVIGVA